MASITKRQAQGKVVYGVRVRRKGQGLVTATFARLTDAKAWAARMEAQISEGKAIPGSAARRHTLHEAIARYTETVMPQKRASTARTQLQQLCYWNERLGQYRMADITTAILVEGRDVLMQRVGPATTVRYLAVLSHLFSVMMREWRRSETNPLQQVSKPKEPRGRVRFLSPDELTQLLVACKETRADAVLYPLVILALSTGGRKGELLGLRWNDVDLRKGHVIFRDTKNGETRSVPVTGQALEVLKHYTKIRRLDSPMVFPSKGGETAIEVKRAWYSALRRAALHDFRFHDLRHCTASFLAMSGATPSELAAVLGHRSLQMVKRYSHISEQHTASVLTRMTETFLAQ